MWPYLRISDDGISVLDEISFRENEGQISWASQFRETAEFTKETSFAKHENRENEEDLK